MCSFMRIKVRDIPPQGLEIRKQLPPEELGLTDKEFRCLSPVGIAARLEKIGSTVIANVNLEGSLSVECGRCLEPVKQPVEYSCDFDYEIDDRTEEIDLGEDIRQELVLALPAAAVCKEDCKGLCPGCGVNLNKETCNCHEDTKS